MLFSACIQDVTAGAKAQGFVTGCASYGCFVSFFGGVKGMIHASELDLSAGKKPSDVYMTGQVLTPEYP